MFRTGQHYYLVVVLLVYRFLPPSFFLSLGLSVTLKQANWGNEGLVELKSISIGLGELVKHKCPAHLLSDASCRNGSY